MNTYKFFQTNPDLCLFQDICPLKLETWRQHEQYSSRFHLFFNKYWSFYSKGDIFTIHISWAVLAFWAIDIKEMWKIYRLPKRLWILLLTRCQILEMTISQPIGQKSKHLINFLFLNFYSFRKQSASIFLIFDRWKSVWLKHLSRQSMICLC